MDYLSNLKKELCYEDRNQQSIRNYLMYLGYRDHYDDPIGISRAYACESLFINHRDRKSVV